MPWSGQLCRTGIYRGLAIVLGAMCPMFLSPANAQDALDGRLTEVERRIDLLSQKVDRLIELMKTQAEGSQPAAVPGIAHGGGQAPAAAMGNARLKSGMTLDVFTIPLSGNFPEEPPSESLGQLIDTDVPILNYGAFQRDATLVQYASSSDVPFVGLYWRGQIEVAEPGQHVFGLLTARAKGGKRESSSYGCYLSLAVDGEVVSRKFGRIRSGEKIAQQAAVDLNPGYYSVAIWKVCHSETRHWQMDFSEVRSTMLMRGPKDATLLPVPKSRVGHL